ncbi:MAG: transcriptional regulator [Robiginitomaculum sp.]|nr:MAG: transcriptional regulator [Robiginitomaculum sp.]
MPKQQAQSQLCNRLKEIRARHNFTQAELAAKVSVTRKTINTVENNVFIPSTVLALKLARALDVRVEELFYLNGS